MKNFKYIERFYTLSIMKLFEEIVDLDEFENTFKSDLKEKYNNILSFNNHELSYDTNIAISPYDLQDLNVVYFIEIIITHPDFEEMTVLAMIDNDNNEFIQFITDRSNVNSLLEEIKDSNQGDNHKTT